MTDYLNKEKIIELLKTSKISEFNQLRKKNPKWRPILRNVDLSMVDLGGVDFGNADLEGANLQASNLEKAFLEGANLRGADLHNAMLRRAYFENADLEGALLDGSNLEKAYFERAFIEGMSLRDAYLKEVDFENADLEESKTDDVITISTRKKSKELRKELTGVSVHKDGFDIDIKKISETQDEPIFTYDGQTFRIRKDESSKIMLELVEI